MKQIPSQCPICKSDISVTRLYCSACDTTIEGHFSPTQSPFAQLTAEQLNFVMSFIRCEGRFTRLEEELNLSYPTLRNRLNEIIRALGFEPGREEAPIKLTPKDRRQILEELEYGRITSEEAKAMLRGEMPLEFSSVIEAEEE
jgi:hypothetical protein